MAETKKEREAERARNCELFLLQKVGLFLGFISLQFIRFCFVLSLKSVFALSFVFVASTRYYGIVFGAASIASIL